MKQAIFEWIDDAQPTMDNFVVGKNSEVCHLLHNNPPQLTLWGNTGCGKTHLLKAWQVHYGGIYIENGADIFRLPEHLHTQHIAFDNIQNYNENQQVALFALFNDCKDQGFAMLFASNTPPAALPLRDDLKTRLAWGAVYEVLALSDDDKINALRQLANERQMYIDDAVFHYLMNFISRDMRQLSGCLKQFDDFAVQHKRRMTVPLLKAFLAEQN